MMRKSIYLVCAITMLGACSQEEFQDEKMQNTKGVVFTTSFEDCTTRTYINESNQLRWTADDRISIFNGNTLNQEFKFVGETGDNGGTFSKVSSEFGTGNDLSCHYAIYPYNINNKISDEGVITTTLPASQNYVENSFGLGANTMVAATQDTGDTFLAFKNVGGYLKLSLYGTDVTVKSITLKGNNGEKIAGKATITHSFGSTPSVAMADDATDEITLDCGAGVTVGSTVQTATAFWFVVPPTIFTGGFCITITNSEGGQMAKATTKSVTIARNGIQPMPAFELKDFIPVIPTYNVETAGTLSTLISAEEQTSLTAIIVKGKLNGDDIKYIQKMTNLSYIDMESADIVVGGSAYYESYTTVDNEFPTHFSKTGRSRPARLNISYIKLPKSITSIGEFALDGCSLLQSIEIPNGVENIGYGAFARTGITDFNIPSSVKTIEPEAFIGCKLTTLFIPNNVEEIGGGIGHKDVPYQIVLEDSNPHFCVQDGVLYNKSMTKIIDYPRHKSETEFTIPTTVNEIGVEAFIGSQCRTINIPEGVHTIGMGAFVGSQLTSLTIPSTIQNIGNMICFNCVNLSSIYIKASTPPVLRNNALDGITTIYVPTSAVNAYKAADTWSSYSSKIQGYSF